MKKPADNRPCKACILLFPRGGRDREKRKQARRPESLLCCMCLCVLCCVLYGVI